MAFEIRLDILEFPEEIDEKWTDDAREEISVGIY